MNNIQCLTKSIEEKWIPIVKGEKENKHTNDCACCQKYWGINGDKYCIGCPVAIDSGQYCGGSPYKAFGELSEETFTFAGINYNLMFDLKAAAQMELDYLINLRDRLKEEV